ncbi:MAG: N-acetyltransferase, partial [Sphingomonadaceae bacterium]|nr:N-acetyltransferase [Sphingomonadaceae bacterium]
MSLSIRVATRDDISLIAQFIRALADYEKLLHEVRFDEAV